MFADEDCSIFELRNDVENRDIFSSVPPCNVGVCFAVEGEADEVDKQSMSESVKATFMN